MGGCRQPNCQYLNCKKMKQLLAHGKHCKKKSSSNSSSRCSVCHRIWTLLQIHARQCRRSNCPVPRCSDVRKHTRFQQSRIASRRRNAYTSSRSGRSSLGFAARRNNVDLQGRGRGRANRNNSNGIPKAGGKPKSRLKGKPSKAKLKKGRSKSKSKK